eukprot:3464326-Lingulodinium_polyedra.AAC.1
MPKRLQVKRHLLQSRNEHGVHDAGVAGQRDAPEGRELAPRAEALEVAQPGPVALLSGWFNAACEHHRPSRPSARGGAR